MCYEEVMTVHRCVTCGKIVDWETAVPVYQGKPPYLERGRECPSCADARKCRQAEHDAWVRSLSPGDRALYERDVQENALRAP